MERNDRGQLIDQPLFHPGRNIQAMPLVVELGVLLDLFVAIFVICIIVNHINQAFSSLDTRRLASLKE